MARSFSLFWLVLARPTSRRTAAIACSLALHAALWKACDVRVPRKEVRATRERTDRPIAVDMVDMVEPPHDAPVAIAKRGHGARKRGPPFVQRKAIENDVPVFSVPKRLELAPSISVFEAPAPSTSASKGRTLHPGDAEAEPQSLAEAANEAKARVDGWARSMLATNRAENGNHPESVHALARALRKAALSPPPVVDSEDAGSSVAAHASALVDSYLGGAERFGATGQAHAAPDGYRREFDVGAKTDEEAAKGSREALYLAARRTMEASLRAYADGRAGTDVVAWVHVRRSSDPTLRSVRIIKASGKSSFDVWVQESAAFATAQADLGDSEVGSSTVWEFRARVTYNRDATQVKSALDALVFAASTSVSGGGFDEVSGAQSYVDPRHPHYLVHVKLLSVE